ncbi:MAG: hypothetical protein ACTTH5_01130 [Wolinella sp.]
MYQNCLECTDACSKVVNALGKETLIGWTSPQAVESLSKEARKDTPLPVRIRAFALDKPEISVLRDSIFVYPRADLIK